MNARQSYLDRDAPPEVKALLAAYVEATGIPVTLSADRAHQLSIIMKKELNPPLGPQDVRTVVFFIRRKMNDPKSGFGETSLDFRKVLGDADLFEERALKCRQHAARKAAAAPKPQVQRVDAAGVARMDADGAQKQPNRADVAAALRGLAKEIGGMS